MSSDLAKLTNAALLEDLGKLKRYGPPGWAVRAARITEEMARRCVTIPEGYFVREPVKTCRLRPLADHVVVLPHEAETLSEGGIVIPETAKEKPRTGEVLAVGPGRTEPGVGTILPALSIGDEVLFGLYSGISFELDGQAVLIMREEDVLGVLQPKAAE